MSQMIDKIEASVAFDESGNIPRGESGERVPPADPTKSPETVTAPPAPSPDPVTPPATVETKTDGAIETDKPRTTPAKVAATPDDKLTPEEEAEIKEKYSRPEDKTGKEHEIRLFRETQKLRKQMAPIQEAFEKIGSPDRARRGLELTADLADPEVPIANAVSKMTALSSSRFQELHDHLYNETLNEYPDVVASDLVGEKATAAELKEGLALLRSGAKGVQPQSATTKTPTAELTKPEGMDDDAWKDLMEDDDFAPIRAAMLADKAALVDAQKAKPAEAKEPELSPAEKQLKEIQEQRSQEARQKGWEEIKGEYGKLYDSAFEVVDKGLRDLGLVPDPAKDDEKTTKLKTRTAERIQEAVYLEFEGPNGPNRTADDPEGQEDWSLCTEEQKLNRGLIKRVHSLMLKKDFAAANDYLDRIRAQVDLAFQRAADPELDLYNAVMLQSTTPKPRDGSAHTRPELVGGTSRGGTPANKTPWLDPGYRQPGETNRDAMMRYLESQAA